MSTGNYSQPVVMVAQPSWFSRFFNWLGWFLFAMTAMSLLGFVGRFSDYFDTTGNITEKYVSGGKMAANKIAVISIEGVIMEGDGFVKRQIDRIRDDEHVKAIVVRVDSPGGTVTGSDYILNHLNKLRKEKQIPLVVSMGSMAASGGYYVSMAVGDQEKSIYAEPTTTTGSIGVIIPHYDISGLMEQFNVKDDSIASGDRKQMLSMTRKLSDDHRQIVKEYIDQAFTRFKSVIKDGRPKFEENPALLDELATGEIFSAVKAKEKGLVDELGFIEDAIDRALELAQLEKEKTRVVKYSRPTALLEALGGAEAKQSQLSLAFELSMPKAYYVATTLPAIFSTQRAD